jgi:hypothetical protein
VANFFKNSWQLLVPGIGPLLYGATTIFPEIFPGPKKTRQAPILPPPPEIEAREPNVVENPIAKRRRQKAASAQGSLAALELPLNLP